MRPLYTALFLLSLAIIGFQIAVMQILSLLQWHHFAGQVISAALLGFGCSGTLLAVARPWFLARTRQMLPMLLLLSAIGMASALPLVQAWFGQFDAQLLTVDRDQFWLLLATQAALFLPLLCGAMAIGLIFISQPQRIGSLYFANLLGSACGGITLLALMWWLPSWRLPAICAAILLAGVVPLKPWREARWLAWLLLATTGAVLALAVGSPAPVPSPYKAVSHALALPEARESARQNSPFGLLQQVAAPSLRYAPELSLAFAGNIPPHAMVYHQGETLGPAQGTSFAQTASLLDHSPRALAFAIAAPRQVLVLGAGTGVAALFAQLRGAAFVMAQQAHPALPAFLARDPAPPERRQHIAWYTGAARPLLAREQRRFDLILLPDVGQQGGDAGLGALTHNHLLTSEGLDSAWQRLSPTGLMQVSVWIDQPLRQPLRLMTSLVAMLEHAGVAKPGAHLAAIRSWASLTIVVSRQPLSPQARLDIRTFSKRLQLDIALLPDMAPRERDYFHALGDSPLLTLLDTIVQGDRRLLQRQYPFRLSPPTDNQPFFAHTLPASPLARPGSASAGGAGQELGYDLLLLSFYQLLLASCLFITAPLLAYRRRSGRARRAGLSGSAGGREEIRGQLATGLYFGAIGLGFMCFEIALLHQLVFYLGQPVFAAAGAIALILLFSGVGSYLSDSARAARPGPAGSTLCVAALIAAFAVMTPPILRQSVAFDLAPRLGILCLLLAPPCLMMGRPFPTALRQLSLGRPVLLPWAWAVNGCASVIAVPLATMVALAFGFSSILLCAALSYLCAALAATQLPGMKY